MKKFLLSILSVFVFAAGAFAGGGGYYDDQFPSHSYIAQDLTNEYVNDHGKLKTYVVYDCTAVLGDWNVEDFVKDEKRKVKVPAGTEVKILSVDDEIKFCHDFDSPVVGDENYGVVYYDYVCKFTVNGKTYTGVIPGVYVSTDSQSVTVDDGTTYTLMCIWTASASLYYSDLRDCNSLEEVGYKIKELQNSVRILEAMGLNEKSRFLLSARIINTKTKNISDINPYVDKEMDFGGNGKISMTYEKNLPVKTIVLNFRNFNGGLGGGCIENTWYALNPETGNTYFICQCSYEDTECWSGSHKITFDSRGATLHVEETDDYGKEVQNSTKTYKQDKNCKYIFDGKYDYDYIEDSKFSTVYSSYFTTENLRLRKTEDTSSETIVIMGKRCVVRVEEIGRKETIDGITSNWVRISFRYGNDKNGKEIETFTQGWCFGGYLSYY